MALSEADRKRLQRQLVSIQERLDEFEEDTENLIKAEYVASVRDARDEIADRLDSITDDEGNLVPDSSTVAATRIAVIQSTSVVEEIWKTYRNRLDKIDEIIQQYYAVAEDVPLTVIGMDRDAFTVLKGQWPRDGVPGAGVAGKFYSMSTHHRRELADALTRNVLGGVPRRALKKQLAEQMDRTEWQAEQVLRDSTIQYSRTVEKKKADDLGYEYFQYFGPVDKITRPFCGRVLDRGPIYSREEINAMDNGQTGAGSVFIAGGGYRCRHRWRAVRKSWYSDAEWNNLRAERLP